MKKFTYLDVKNNPSLPYWIVITIAVIIGIYIRLKGLGTWSLALDEYYIIQSVENILKYGLPQFENGGYYTRGILMQYLIAPLLALGVKAELAGRIFPVLSNLAAIPALYLIAKKVGNQLLAAAAVVIFSFSIWEIEMARFARMYAPFQTIFIWYVYFALKDFENKDLTNFKWLLLFSTISIFIYEGSIFLALFNFVPFILLRKLNLKYLFWAAVVLVVALFSNQFDLRTLNSNPIFPPEYIEEIQANISEAAIKIPKILLLFAFKDTMAIIAAAILFLINTYLVFYAIKFTVIKNFWSIFSVLLLGILAFLNQFGIFLLCISLLAFWKLLEINYSNRRLIYSFLFIFLINLCFWYIFGALTKEWYTLFDDFSSYSLWGVSKRLFVGFFNYPDNYLYLLNYYRTLPLLTIFSVLASLNLFLFLFFYQGKFEQINFLFGTLIFFGLFATIPTLLYRETRYTFFLVPILLILILISVNKLTSLLTKRNIFSKVLFVLFITAVFISSEDFNLYHLMNIDRQDVNYRMIYKNRVKVHLYRRWDVLTPTNFVKKNLSENDKILINENSLKYYLPRVNYFNFDYRNAGFVALTVEEGNKERWSNAKLIYKNDDLINFIENRQTTIWYLVFPEPWLFEIDFYERYKEYLVYQGVDGLIKVFKFPHSIRKQIGNV